MPGKKLTHKQEKFCVEYLVDLNATQAAIRAGYSPKTAKEIGYQNFTKLHLKERIAELQDELRQKAIESGEIATPEEILMGHTRDIRFNPKSFYDETGGLIPIHKLDDEVALSLAGAKTTISATGIELTEYKYPDKIRCRESMAKMLGMIPRNGNGKNGDGDEINIEKLQININTEPARKVLEDG
jgi:phage terminase small subunit